MNPFLDTVPTNFKYLVTTFTLELNDSNNNIQLRIDQASKVFYYAMNKNIFRRKDINSKLRLRTYNAMIINLLVLWWGCKSWALKTKDGSKSSTTEDGYAECSTSHHITI
jgi:hypothetical protein